MELLNDPLFMGLRAQVQAQDAVLNALLITHPAPVALLAEIEQHIALLRSSIASKAAMIPARGLDNEMVIKKTEAWLRFAREHLG